MDSALHKRKTQRPAQSGVALLEALVALMLLSVGMLGIVTLQSTLTRAQTDAKFRSDAAYLGSEAIGLMWMDRANLVQYATTPGTECVNTRCADWLRKVSATLPGGQATITPTATNVGLTLTWSMSGEETHTYATFTAIQ